MIFEHKYSEGTLRTTVSIEGKQSFTITLYKHEMETLDIARREIYTQLPKLHKTSRFKVVNEIIRKIVNIKQC